MIEHRNIVCIASNWYYDPTSKHHVMRELSRCNHVVWVNYHGSRRPSATGADLRAAAGKLRQFIEGPRRVSESMTVLTPLVAPWPGNRAAAALNRRLLVRQIRRVLAGLPRRPVQVWSFAPDVGFLCGQFEEESFVYYCVDAFSEFAGYDRRAMLEAEACLAARADLVVTTSRRLFEDKQGLGSRTILVPHGVDAAHFAQAEHATPPEDVAHLPRPILGFWGMVEDWIDVELLAQAARAWPQASFVLIGEIKTDVSGLRACPNVHLLGRRPYSQLPGYAAGFDAALLPFRINDLTRAVNPIKLREYLAAGLPVVSTALPEVEPYRPDVHVARSSDTFVDICQSALAADSPAARAARRAAMQRETWPEKVRQIGDALVGTGRPRVTAGPPRRWLD